MKKMTILFLAAFLVFFFVPYGKAAGIDSGPLPTIGEERETENEDDPPVFPAGPTLSGEGEEDAAVTSSADSAKKNTLYDPSIFVIQAEGVWRQELVPGFYIDYECELYLDKFDGNDNRSASGIYTGVFWMKTSVDAEEYLKKFLAKVPVAMDFAADGEGICDNLTMHLLDGYERDPFGDYAIPDGQGSRHEPAKDALAGEGSFLAVGTRTYLEARARGAAGEKLEHQDSQTSDEEIQYVIQIEPDPTKTATERKVTIYLSNAKGMAVTIAGVWRRLPGYPEDMLEYANAQKYNEVLNKHLK